MSTPHEMTYPCGCKAVGTLREHEFGAARGWFEYIIDFFPCSDKHHADALKCGPGIKTVHPVAA